MRICGLQKLAMVDFPGKLAATVFTGGCNLRCPFCHNALLVNRLEENPETHSVEEVLDFLKKRKGFLDGVVLSGGEPLLAGGAADFLAAVKAMGFAVKLDTNGCYPDRLKEILDRGLVDYVAMDIKNCREKYAETVGIPGFDTGVIEESIHILKESGLDFELRTTVVKQFHTADDIAAIGQWVGGAKHYYLQNFEDSGNLIGQGLTGFTEEEIRQLQKAVEPYFQTVGIRGY